MDAYMIAVDQLKLADGVQESIVTKMKSMDLTCTQDFAAVLKVPPPPILASNELSRKFVILLACICAESFTLNRTEKRLM
jgi:hypothetical protein